MDTPEKKTTVWVILTTFHSRFWNLMDQWLILLRKPRSWRRSNLWIANGCSARKLPSDNLRKLCPTSANAESDLVDPNQFQQLQTKLYLLVDVLKKLDTKCTEAGPASPEDIKMMLKAIIGADEETTTLFTKATSWVQQCTSLASNSELYRPSYATRTGLRKTLSATAKR